MLPTDPAVPRTRHGNLQKITFSTNWTCRDEVDVEGVRQKPARRHLVARQRSNVVLVWLLVPTAIISIFQFRAPEFCDG